MKLKFVFASVSVLIGSAWVISPQMATAKPPHQMKEVIVDCTTGNSLNKIMTKVGSNTHFIIIGNCSNEGNVLIELDDITISSDNCSGSIDGSLRFIGAQRGVVDGVDVSGPGEGVLIDHGASVTVQESCIHDNGVAGEFYSPGIWVRNGSTAKIKSNLISNNLSDGIGVENGASALVHENVISENGRAGQFEGGILVSHGVVRAQSNEISNNAYAALEIFNSASYRTGTFISEISPDNMGLFGVLDKGESGVKAVEAGRESYVDLRQVFVTGNIDTFGTSHIQIRGDARGAVNCTVINGDVSANGFGDIITLSAVTLNGSTSGNVDISGITAGGC